MSKELGKKINFLKTNHPVVIIRKASISQTMEKECDHLLGKTGFSAIKAVSLRVLA